MGYFLDRVFQRFLDKLVQHVHNKHPLRSAAKELKGFQKEEVDRVFANMGSGVFPNIPLPMSLSGGAPPMLPPISRPGGSPPNFGNNTKTDGVNRGAVLAWAIPSGKKFNDFFDPRKFPDNLKGWPKLDHHASGTKQMLCLKFQVHGKCQAPRCNLSHVDPRQLDRDVYDKVAARLLAIYKN